MRVGLVWAGTGWEDPEVGVEEQRQIRARMKRENGGEMNELNFPRCHWHLNFDSLNLEMVGFDSGTRKEMQLRKRWRRPRSGVDIDCNLAGICGKEMKPNLCLNLGFHLGIGMDFDFGF